MNHSFGRTVVVALGGSIVFPGGIDPGFLRRFRTFLSSYEKTKKFLLVIGGGRLAREYQEAGGCVRALTNNEKDWLGIHATRANAEFLRIALGKVADPRVIAGKGAPRLRFPVTIACGWGPGYSTDYVAIALAAKLKVPEVVVAGRPAFVYDRDFVKAKKAKPITVLSWAEYRTLIPSRWDPGAHAPIDPVAARLAEKKGIEAIVIEGRNLKNLGFLLRGGNFFGSRIN